MTPTGTRRRSIFHPRRLQRGDARWTAQRFGNSFPYATLIVNLSGCFLISLILQSATAAAWSPTLRSALTIGFVGGLTTYSSFNYETTQLLQEGAANLAAFNATMMIVGCALAGWLGVIASRHLLGH